MSRRAGFTLLEICFSVCICLLIVFIAVPSVRGVLAEQRLAKTKETFDTLVRKAQARSVDERRTYVLAWKKTSIDLLPWELHDGEKPPMPESLPVGSGEDYALERTAALTKNPPLVWTFWRSGVCEPATVSYKGPAGTWSAKYDPLTAHGKFLTEEVK